jgi:hypothetical protein
MRRVFIAASALVCAAVFAVVAAPASASSTSNFEATFQFHYGHQIGDPCSAGFTGTVAGYGSATGTCTVTVTPIPGSSCVQLTISSTITLADGSTLSLESTATSCAVGGSGSAPGSSVSYGNPISLLGTYTITSGTGVFAGGSGGGTLIDYFAGDVQVVELVGTIALP